MTPSITATPPQGTDAVIQARRRSVEKRLMRQLAILSALIAVVAFVPGCFVIDELDSGMELMQEHSPQKGKKGAAEEAPSLASTSPDGEKPSARAAVAEWWKSARTPSSGPQNPETATEIVSCRIGDGVRFMARNDCEVQGGSF